MRSLLKIGLAALLAILPASTAPARQESPAVLIRFVYDDFDRFAAALAKVEAGEPAKPAFQAFIDGAGPAYGFYRERYGATAASLADAVRKRPNHYRRVAGLKDYLRSQEPVIAAGIGRLSSMFPEIRVPPVYFMVGNVSAGGIHAKLDPPVDGHGSAPALLVEGLAMSPDTDMTEWPRPYGGGYLEDIAYAAVHETIHAFQARIQGIANYVSIYSAGQPNNSYLALAIREGCADYVTRLAIGRSRTGNQESYGLAHEQALWDGFRKVMHQPASFEDGWFGALDPRTPEWPPQIGYWLGQRICGEYHRTAADKQAAMRQIFAAYRAEEFSRIAEPYARRMSEARPAR